MAIERNKHAAMDSVPQDFNSLGKPAVSTLGGLTKAALSTGVATDPGPLSANDDTALVSYKTEFFAISDGISGAPHGNIMSQVACRAAIDEYERCHDLVAAFSAGNNAACQVSHWMDSPDSGATLLLAASKGTTMSFASAGDTLAFRLRDGKLNRIFNPERTSESNPALTSAVGYFPYVQPLIHTCSVEPGDRFLLATDGVWDVLSTERIEQVLSQCSHAPWAANLLVTEAAAIGSDNATAIVLYSNGASGESDRPSPYRYALGSTPVLGME